MQYIELTALLHSPLLNYKQSYSDGLASLIVMDLLYVFLLKKNFKEASLRKEKKQSAL